MYPGASFATWARHLRSRRVWNGVEEYGTASKSRKRRLFWFRCLRNKVASWWKSCMPHLPLPPKSNVEACRCERGHRAWRLLFFAHPCSLPINTFNTGQGGRGNYQWNLFFWWRLLFFANTGPQFGNRISLHPSPIWESNLSASIVAFNPCLQDKTRQDKTRQDALQEKGKTQRVKGHC